MIDLGRYSPLFGGFIYLYIFICGLILGSFLNSWMWRVRDNIRIFSNSRSICPHCRYQLHWYENMPLLSFLFLRAHCSNCKQKIHFSYFFVELITGFLLIFVSLQFLKMPSFSEWQFLRDVLFLTYLMVIFVYDFRYREVLTSLTWSGAIIAILINYYALNYSLWLMFLGMLVAGGFFLLQYVISRGRWIGGGDVRLGFMIGAWLGWPNVLVALFFAYIFGAIVSVLLLILKKADRKTKIPFGTFLAMGTFFALYYGERIVTWYLGMMR